MRYNKGEWSELYAFIKLLKDGRIYAADQYANKISEQYLPIIRIIREENPENRLDYYTGETIKILSDGKVLKEIPNESISDTISELFSTIFSGSAGDGAFEILSIEPFMKEIFVSKVKASSKEKVDIEMQIRDTHTGFDPEVGFSIKSDVGSPPTLLNAGKNTRFRYRITGLSDESMNLVNAIDKSVCREYMKSRFSKLVELSDNIEFDKVLDPTFEDNLILIDSNLPEIYGNMILQHYKHISESITDCFRLIGLVADENPLKYHRTEFYAVKLKKLLTASALGMTPGTPWDGKEAATGGYIIIKKDGDVLCYHLYNRNFFEDYLLNNTIFDRPSASRHDYGYVYELDGEKYIDLNVQVRFKSIGAAIKSAKKYILPKEETFEAAEK